MINVMDYLSVGKENVRTANEISEVTGIDKRVITDAIHTLKVQGKIICACREGYYLPADKSDVLKIYRRTANRIRAIEKTMPPMEDYLKRTE